jgi:SEC-C motif-containing protein
MMAYPPTKPCPCGSGDPYQSCCAPYHRGKPAPTPEALMRSRFTAYAIGEPNYIMDTTHPDGDGYQHDRAAWRKQLRAYMKGTQFLALHVTGRELSDDDETGFVTFHALLAQGGQNASFIERSRFVKQGGRWLYIDGIVK